MHYRTLSILGIFLLTGCAMYPQMDSIRKVADTNQFQGLTEKTRFDISFPSPHSGQYESVDQLNFIIDQGKHKGKNASALLVKAHKTEIWKVLTIMVEENGKWIKIPKSNKKIK